MTHCKALGKVLKNQWLSKGCHSKGKELDFFFRHLDKPIFVNKCGLAKAWELAFYGTPSLLSYRFCSDKSYQADKNSAYKARPVSFAHRCGIQN
jgi:hypothetical protein